MFSNIHNSSEWAHLVFYPPQFKRTRLIKPSPWGAGIARFATDCYKLFKILLIAFDLAFPLGGRCLQQQTDEEKLAFLFCLKNFCKAIFQTKGRSPFLIEIFPRKFSIKGRNLFPCSKPSPTGEGVAERRRMRGASFFLKETIQTNERILFSNTHNSNEIG